MAPGYSGGVPGTRLRILWLLLLCVSVAACPGRRKRNLGPPKLVVPSNGDSQARGRFEMSRSQFERDGEVDNSEAFEAIVRDYPDDPIIPHALLYGAMADLRVGDAASALTKLDELKTVGSQDPMLVARARLFRGLALSSLLQTVEALEDLRAGARALARGSDDEMGYWHAAMAEGSAAQQDIVAAIPHYDSWYHYAGPSERSYALDRIRSLAAALAETQLEPVFANLEFSDGPAAALVGGRFAALLQARGDGDAAGKVLAKIASAQRALGMGVPTGLASAGNADSIGALLPLSGRLNRIGELSMRGLVLASGSHPGAQQGSSLLSPFQLVARDTSSQLVSVAEGVKSLAQDDVIAVIGPFDGRAVLEAGSLASTMALPVLSLAPRGKGGPGIFAIRHSAEDRARSLARHAYGAGVRDFAIFAPSGPYGTAVGLAFRNEVEALGGTVVVEVNYAKGTTSFKDDLKKLKKPWSAVFVPDLAKSLQLIAPALAAANLHAMPRGKKSKHGRSILLLSTAEGIEHGYLRSAGRYSLGAILAPGYYSDRTDARIAEFVARYVAHFGSEPSAHEAYAFDAAAVVRHATDAGAKTRGQLHGALLDQSVPGLTGEIQFAADGRRSDAGLLFEMQEPISGQYQLKALR